MAAHISGKLHYEQHGKHGPVMLFIHGNPYDHRLWMYQTAHFSSWFRTIAVDVPPYGRSPSPTPGLTLTDLAAACWEVIDEITRDPVILVGNSVGATTVIYMTGLRPQQARALIVTGCAYWPNRDFARQGGAQWDKLGIEARRATFDAFVSSALRADPHAQYLQRMFLETNDRMDVPGIREIFRALEEPEPEAVYDRIDQPCLIITGTEDPAHQGGLDMQRRIKGAELAIIEGAGHVCNLDNPVEWDRHAVDFLRRHRLFDASSK
ncbi:MAG TPA: alpha/beta hydrolase [Candidatus Binataceae bacterium]|nr:alpha/beta hydrolase [Candidatus Binataceae bacterium]